MANWKEYTTKTTPEDADEIMIADSEANASKRTPFSGLWNWIANNPFSWFSAAATGQSAVCATMLNPGAAFEI